MIKMSEFNVPPKSQRLISLDALRGFDMFWITGGQKIIFASAANKGLPVFTWLNGQVFFRKTGFDNSTFNYKMTE